MENESEKKRRYGRYQLRHAAGLYWLLDMEQSGASFQKPVPINEMGALIWNMMEQGQTDELIDRLCGEYGVEREQAIRDVRQFLQALKEHGIFFRDICLG